MTTVLAIVGIIAGTIGFIWCAIIRKTAKNAFSYRVSDLGMWISAFVFLASVFDILYKMYMMHNPS